MDPFLSLFIFNVITQNSEVASISELCNFSQEGAFAQFKLWQSLSIAVIFFISPHVAFHIMLLIMLTSVCVSLIAFLFLTLKVEAAFSIPI